MHFNNILDDAKEDSSVTIPLTTANAEVAERKKNGKALPAPAPASVHKTHRNYKVL